MNGEFGFSIFTSLIPIIFTVIFTIVIVGIIVTIIKGLGTWRKNNSAPQLTVEATIVSKRTNVNHHHDNNTNINDTSYYVTFQVESGDRIELRVYGEEYGLLVEGNKGKLTFQGTRYKGFVRN